MAARREAGGVGTSAGNAARGIEARGGELREVGDTGQRAAPHFQVGRELADKDPHEALDQDRLRRGEIAALAVGDPAARCQDLVEVSLLSQPEPMPSLCAAA